MRNSRRILAVMVIAILGLLGVAACEPYPDCGFFGPAVFGTCPDNW